MKAEFVQKLGSVWERYLRCRPGGTVDENETRQEKKKEILEKK
jgi:hypothetical protein